MLGDAHDEVYDACVFYYHRILSISALSGIDKQNRPPYSTRMKNPILPSILALTITLLAGCARENDGITVIWTDQSEFAAYAEIFNESQSRFKVSVEYKENPAEALIDGHNLPDIVVGPWLKGERTRSRLVPVDYLFNELRINSKQFYQPLIDLGNVHGRQYLLPVSFNLTALIFSPENKILPGNDSLVSLEQVRELSGEFNLKQKGAYAKMGFSPRWNREFLYIIAKLYDAGFEENDPLFKWDQTSLKEAVAFIRDWSANVNTSTSAEDDFEFKYLYDPPYKLVTGGRNLFSYITSGELLVLPHEKIQNLDFRWIARDGMTPVKDSIVYMGICRNARHLDGAEAFLSWFFSERTQKTLLDKSRTMRIMDRSFGISGGFSAIVAVNEKSFPLYYPSLLGHLPPTRSLAVPYILPNNWETLKNEIVIPYLTAAVETDGEKESEVESLEERIADWKKGH